MAKVPSTTSVAREHPVLHLGHRRVAWVTSGSRAVAYEAEYEPDTTTPTEAATAVLGTHGERPRSCILGLDESFYLRRRVDLPSSLQGRGLRAVLQRKADSLFEGDGSVVFHALALTGDRQKAREGMQSWLIFAAQVEAFHALIACLRLEGFRVVRIVASEVAYQGLALTEDLEDGQSTIIVGQLGDSIGVSLVSRAGLVTQSLVSTGSMDPASVASTLVRELRALDGVWRRVSEGGLVTRVSLVGFGEHWDDMITPAVTMIFPEADLVFDADLSNQDAESGSWVSALAACRLKSQLSVEFTLTVPPSRRVGVALVAASLGLIVSVGGLVAQQCDTRAGIMRDDIQMRLSPESAIEEAAEIQAELAGIEHIKAELEAEWTALREVNSSSLPFEKICGQVLQALGSKAALEALQLDFVESSVDLQVTAVSPADWVRSSDAMKHALEGLERTGNYEELNLEPESRIPMADDGAQLVHFTIDGGWTPSDGLERSEELDR